VEGEEKVKGKGEDQVKVRGEGTGGRWQVEGGTKEGL